MNRTRDEIGGDFFIACGCGYSFRANAIDGSAADIWTSSFLYWNCPRCGQSYKEPNKEVIQLEKYDV